LGGLAAFAGNVYFSADTPTTDAQPGVFSNPVLFQLNSAGVTSEVLLNGHPVTDAGEDGGFFSFNSHLYFFADDSSASTFAGLFAMDSTGNISELIDPTDNGPLGAPQSATAHFTVFDGNLYFEAETGKGDELVEIDSLGNIKVIDVNPSLGPPIGDSFPGENGGFGAYTPIATVFGSSGNDNLSGGANTVFIGGKGNDTIHGAGTNDTAVIDANFSDPSTHVTISGNTVTVVTANGTDTLTGIDRIQFADKGLLIVDPNGDFGFSHVQDAVNAATEGDTIWVMPGTYTETFTPAPFSATEGGLFIDTPNLTLQGVDASGNPITSVTDANKNTLPLIISGAQTDFGSNIFVGPNADNTTIEGLHLQAGPETNNKLLEIWANNATVENNFLDVNIGGTTYSGAIAIYFNDNGTPFTDEIASYTVAGNILNEGIDASNGVGIPGTPIPNSDLIVGNTFEGTFDISTGLGRYDTIVVNGDVPGIGWLLESTENPTVAGNLFGDNTTPFLLRGSDISLADLPTLSDVQTFLASNGTADTTYAYAINGTTHDLEVADRNTGSGPFFSFAVTNTVDTLELALESAGNNTVFPDQRFYVLPGDTVVIQSGPNPLSSSIDVNNLSIEANADSAHLTLTMATQLPDGEPIPGAPVTQLTLLDYAPNQGANVTVIGNDLGDTVTTNSGSDTLQGGIGIDAAVYNVPLQISSFGYDSVDNVWHVSKGGGQQDTISAFEQVNDAAGHHFLLVGGGSQYATIQAAVNAAHDGDIILVAPGTYTEDVAINGKALTIEGFGGANGVGGAVLNGSFTESGPLNGNLTIEGFIINAAGQQDGISLSPLLANPETVNVNNDSVTGASQTGFIVNGGGPDLAVTTTNSTFSGNGFLKTFGGSGDITFFDFLGNASFVNLLVAGAAPGAPLTAAGDNGIQIAGFDSNHDVTSPLGQIIFDNVTVTGTYAKTLVYIQGYDDASGLQFLGPGLTLGNGTTQTGWTPLFIDLGPQGGSYMPSATPSTLDLSDVHLDGSTFVGTDPNFAALAAAGYQDLIVGADGVHNTITGTANNDAIIYNQQGLGTETIDGGAGTDAAIINTTPGAVENLYINPIDPTHLGIEFSPFAILNGAADSGNASVITTNVEEIVVNLATDDFVTIAGNLQGTGVLTSTVTVNGAGDNDVDATHIDPAHPVDVVFNSGGGSTFHSGPGNDTFTNAGGHGTATYTETLTSANFSYSGGNWIVTTASEGTDTLHGVSVIEEGTPAHNILLVSPDSQYTTIQAAVNAANDGDTILVAPGTYTEDVSINGKALTIEGFGGANGVGGAVLDGSFTETGALDGKLTIEGFTINATGQQDGISLTPTLTGPATISINDVSVTGASQTGLLVLGGGTQLTINTLNSSFVDNGIAKTSGGSGGITYFEFLGSAAFLNDQVVGSPQNTPLANAGDNGIQIAGFDEATKAITSPLGIVSFDDVSVTGTFAKTLVYIQGYDDASNLQIGLDGLVLGNATTQSGWTPMFVDLGSQGGPYTLDPTPPSSINLQSFIFPGVTVAGWSFVGSDPAFAPLAAAGVQVVVKGTPGDDTIVNSVNNDFIAGNGGTDTVDYIETLTAADFSYNTTFNAWTVTTSTEGTDLLLGVTAVGELFGGPHFLMVGQDSAYHTVQSALDAAQPGDTILVPEGNFTTQDGAITIVGSGGEMLTMTPGNNQLVGGAGNDVFVVSDSSVFGSIDGGAGHNVIYFTDQVAAHELIINPVGFSVATNIQEIDLVDPTTFAPDDVSKIVSATTFATGLTFVGNNTTDEFFAGSGDDTFAFTSAQFAGKSDVINGGLGSDTLLLTDTTAPVTIADADLVNVISVETIKTATSGDISLTLGPNAFHDIFGAGESELTVDVATALGKLTLDASGLTDGSNTVTLDVLLGTDGNDILTGGPGENIYQFGAPPTAGNDQITNFTSGKDAVAVSAAGFGGGLAVGEDVTSIFETSGNSTFTSTADRFHFDTANHGLYFSADGTTGHEVLLAQVTNGATIHPNDVHVVA
jgi:Ca2+-binding RTX toxin-like protein